MMVVYPWNLHLFFIAFFCLLSLLECRPFGNLPTKKYRLQADEFPEGVEKRGDDLWITKPGKSYDLVLKYDKLELGTPQSCIGDVLACYKSATNDISPVANYCHDHASTCTFYVTMDEKWLWFMAPKTDFGHEKQDCGAYPSVALTGDVISFCKTGGPSCSPMIQKGHTSVYVKQASTKCPLIIKNANIKSPETTTHLIGHNGSSTTESSGAAMADWLIAVIVIASILAFGLLCGLGWWIYIQFFKKKDSKQIFSGTTKNTILQIGDQTEGAHTDKVKPLEAKTMLPITCAPAKQVQPAAVEKVLPVEVKANKPDEHRPVDKAEELATAKPAPIESKEPVEAPAKPQVVAEPAPKALKELEAVVAKEVVKDEKIGKENKAGLKVNQQENRERPSDFQVICPSQLRRNCWPARPDAAVPKLVEKSNKSGSVKSKKKADSLQMQMQDMYRHLLPTHIDSLYQIFHTVHTGAAWWIVMKYPRAPFILEREVHLLLCPVSEMFDELEKMGADAEAMLLKAGLVLDSKKRIVGQINDRVRKLIIDKETPEYVRYYMFSLEFGKLITPHADNLGRMSLALLFVVAIGPMFDVLIRKKAAAHLRRKQVNVQEWWFAEERRRMPFPISALQAAYNKDRRAFCDEENIKTDSQRSKRERAAVKKDPSADNITIETETHEGNEKQSK